MHQGVNNDIVHVCMHWRPHNVWQVMAYRCHFYWRRHTVGHDSERFSQRIVTTMYPSIVTTMYPSIGHMSVIDFSCYAWKSEMLVYIIGESVSKRNIQSVTFSGLQSWLHDIYRSSCMVISKKKTSVNDFPLQWWLIISIICTFI